MEYPKLPPSLDRRRKLSDSDIEEIRKSELTNKELTKFYPVSAEAIRLVRMSDEQRLELSRNRYEKYIKDNPKAKQMLMKASAKCHKRLKEVNPLYKPYIYEINNKSLRTRYKTDKEYRENKLKKANEQP